MEKKFLYNIDVYFKQTINFTHLRFQFICIPMWLIYVCSIKLNIKTGNPCCYLICKYIDITWKLNFQIIVSMYPNSIFIVLIAVSIEWPT